MSAKRKKKLPFWLTLLIFLAVLIVAISASSELILAKVLESAIGAPVKINKFHINLFAGEIGINGLVIRNPKGFNEKLLTFIPEIFIHVDSGAIFQNRIHVQEVRLNLDEITVERNQSGKINLMELGAVKKSAKESQPPAGVPQPFQPSSPSQKPGKPAKPPNIQIDTVSLSLGRARYVDYSFGQPITKTFPLEIKNEVLHNITDPAQITQQIVSKTLKRVGMNALAQQLGVNVDLGEQWQQALASLKEKFKF